MNKPPIHPSACLSDSADANLNASLKPSIWGRLKSWLSRSLSRKAILLLGVILVLPSISHRLVLDDYLLALTQISAPPADGVPHSWLDLFVFGKPGKVNDGFMERGILLPWWTYREYRVAFFRPLSALTHDLDGWLWPHSPVMAHVQSIAWYVLLLFVVLSLYEKFSRSAWLAGLAFLLFVIDDTHGDTINWLANRHAIIATALGLLVLAAHDRYRRGQGKRGAWIGPALFVVNLLAGETALATCAYLFSYALFLDPAPRRSRAWSLLPYVSIVVAWRAFYQWLGYGAFGGDGYIDPGREPGAFIERFLQAFAVLLQGQLGFIPSDFWPLSPPEIRWIIVVCAYAFSALFFWLVYSLLRRDRVAMFWCAAMLGAIIPNTAAPVGDRTLLFSGVAAAPLLAQLFSAFFDRMSPLLRRPALRHAMTVLIAAIALQKVLLAPLLLLFRLYSIEALAEISDRAADAIPRVAGLSQRSLIIANPPATDLASYLPLIRATRGQSVPRHVRWFSTATSDITMTRTSERSILVRPSRGFWVDGADRIFRGSRYPMKLGEKVELSDMTATITELAEEGNPAAVEFTFREPLESASYLWMRWDQHQCKTFAPPRVGETITLPAIDGIKLLQNR
jgi:hypothetical protein